MGKKMFLALSTLAGLFAVDALAQSTALSGTAGSYTASGTDTYGMKEILVKLANFVSDDGLNKIVGFGGTTTGLAMMYGKAYVPGAMTAVVSLGVGFLPKIVDGLYGAII